MRFGVRQHARPESIFQVCSSTFWFWPRQRPRTATLRRATVAVRQTGSSRDAMVQKTGACESRLREQWRQQPSPCALSTSAEVDAAPASQPSMIQHVRRKPRSRENRYLPRNRVSVRARSADAVDPATGRDNFRDTQDQIVSPITPAPAYT